MENIDKKPVFLAKTLILKDFLLYFEANGQLNKFQTVLQDNKDASR